MASNITDRIEFAQTETLPEREAAATACTVGLRLSLPVLVDTEDNRADLQFNAWPERLYVLSVEGEVVYQGGKGPYGFDPEEMERFLEAYLSDANADAT